MYTLDFRSIHSPRTLPLVHDLSLAYALSFTVAALVAVTSLSGLLFADALYPAETLLVAFAATDVGNLLVGIPLLLGAMWVARRGGLVGLLCWLGALFYVLYVYVPYVIAVPLNVLFLAYVALIPLSVYALIAIVANVDVDAMRQQLSNGVPARLGGGILLGLAALVILYQLATIIPPLIEQAPVGMADIALWIDDFAVAVPALIVSGVLLWRRQPLGYLLGASMLFAYGVLALVTVPILMLEARYTGALLDGIGVTTLLAMAAVCFVPFAFFVRSAARQRRKL